MKGSVRAMPEAVSSLCNEDRVLQARELIRTKIALTEVFDLLKERGLMNPQIAEEFKERKPLGSVNELMSVMLSMANRCIMAEISHTGFSNHLCNTIAYVEERLKILSDEVDAAIIVEEVFKQKNL